MLTAEEIGHVQHGVSFQMRRSLELNKDLYLMVKYKGKSLSLPKVFFDEYQVVLTEKDTEILRKFLQKTEIEGI